MSDKTEQFKKYYYDNGSLRMQPKDFEADFVTYLNKFDSLDATVDGKEMSKGEKNCWTALKEYQKENGGEENAQSVDMDNVQFKYIVDHPTYTSMIKNVAALGVENCGYPSFQFTAFDKNNMAWINSIKNEASTLGEVLDKAQEELDKKEGKNKDEDNPENQKEGEKETEGKEEGKEDKPKEKQTVWGILVTKTRESNEKAMGIFHDKGDSVSRKSRQPVFEEQIEKLGEMVFGEESEPESENENQGVHIDMEVIEQEREAAGLVEPEPESLTNFSAQAVAEEEMSRNQEQAETMLEMGMDKNN